MRQLSSQDAAFLYAETPTWHMHVSALAIIDPSRSDGRFSIDRARELLLERLPELPQFRWRLVDTPLGVDRPYWIEAEELDPEYHLRHLTVPPPGDETALDRLVAELIETKLDRSRPLWEMWYLDGLLGGRVAVLTKMHHSLVDGVSGAGLMEIMLDVTPEPRPPVEDVREPIGSQAEPGVTRFARGVVTSAVRTPIRLATFAGQSMRQGVAAAARLRPGARPAIPYNAPRTRLNGEIGPKRAIGRANIDLARVQRVKHAYGVKVNDIVLAMVAGSLRQYLAFHDDLPVQPLLAQVPVSLRTTNDRDHVGSKVGSLFVRLPTNLDDPEERVRAVTESTRDGKDLHQAFADHRYVGITETMSPGLLGVFARLYTGLHLEQAPPTVNVVVSNVPGPPIPLYICGAPLEAMYPMGPLLMGMAVNITAFSHDGHLAIGVMSAPDLVPDPERIADGLEGALDELEAATRQRGSA